MSEYVAVEDDKHWFNQVTELKLPNINITHVSQTDDPILDHEYRELLYSYPYTHKINIAEQDVKHGISCEGFEDYAKVIRKYPDEYFDFIVVDGKARFICTYEAINKVKPDGWIILDNSDRIQYQNIFSFLKNFA